jgi:Ca2+-binding EF-hand superfamily protein
MKTLTIAVLFLGTLLVAGMGYNMPSFNSFDLNNDGTITQKEFESARAAKMQKQADEGRMLRNAANAPSFSNIDTNGDGVIDKAEFTKHQQTIMAR